MQNFEKPRHEKLSDFVNFETGCPRCDGAGCPQCLKNYDELLAYYTSPGKYEENEPKPEIIEKKVSLKELKTDEGEEIESRCNSCGSTDYNDISCSQCGFGRTKQPIKSNN